MKPIKLKAIVEEMGDQADGYRKFHIKSTGEIITVSCKDLAIAEASAEADDFSRYPKQQRDNILKALEIIEDENYIDMPDKDEIDEYSILERFAYDNDELEWSMITVDHQEVLISQGIEGDWNDFRREAFTKIAKEWCTYHVLSYNEG